MFSTLSSYIWASRPEDQTVPDGLVEVREKLAESEWILVDVVKPSTSAVKSAKMDAVGGKQLQDGNLEAVPHFGEGLEQSWYITPPSCFNASQPHSSTLETSPLENLLIEHPSMSVYGGNTALLEHDGDMTVAEQTLENSQNDDSGRPVGTPAAHQHRRVLRVVDKVELLKRRMQRTVVEQAKKKLRNKKLERHNKTQKHAPHSRRKQKKIDRKHGKHSGVFSHRGC